jgi:hypothetical protein
MKKSSRKNSAERDPGSSRSKGDQSKEKSKHAKKDEPKREKRESVSGIKGENGSKGGVPKPQQNAFEKIKYEKQGNDVYKNLIQVLYA